jgi:hypothetical protein
MFFYFCLIAVEFARSPMHSLDRKPLNMGIAGDKPHQMVSKELIPSTVGYLGGSSLFNTAIA